MARELFVYWKVERALAPQAHRAAVGLLETLRGMQPALQAQLLRRADEAGGKATFMETYSAAATGVTPAMQAAIEAQAQLAFAALGSPARHVEVFERLSPGNAA